MDESDVCRPRTPLLTAGVILTAVHGLVGWIASALLAAIATGRLGELRARLVALENGWIDLALGWAGLLGWVGVALYSLQLIACAGAWSGSRGWTWTLLGTSLVGALNSGPVSFVVGVMTVVGAAQVLDQSRPFPPPEPPLP